MQKRNTLWTRDFTIITLGTVISAIGGTAMSFALSIVVYDNTSSAWLAGFFNAVSLLPSLVFPLLFAPYVDSHHRKPLIVGLDALLAVVYLGFGLVLMRIPFSYGMYMAIGLISNSIGSLYSTTYNAFYPDLIPEGFLQKGYSVSSIIYPTVTVVITPLAAMVYEHTGMHTLFFIEAGLLLAAALMEMFIRAPEKHVGAKKKERFSFRAWREQLLGGVHYLRGEKGVRSLYTNMAIINATSVGTNLMMMTFFQSSPILTTAMYSLLISAETLGRTVGGILHYLVKVPRAIRYRVTIIVYYLYQAADGVLLFLPYPAMLGTRFACGFMGVNTATLRSAAVQHHLPANVRARVNGLFSVITSAGITIMQLLSGALGEILPYRAVPVLLAVIGIISIYFIIQRNKRHIEPLFDADY